MEKDLSNRKKDIRNFSICTFFLVVYILTSYIAKEGLLPAKFNSLALYAFIGVSFFCVVCNMKDIKLPNFTIWYIVVLFLSFISFFYGPNSSASALYIMVVALVLSFCFIIVVDDFKKIDIVARAYTWSCVLMTVLLFVTDQLILNVEEGERLGEKLTGNANSFSNLVLVAAIFAAWYMVYCGRKIRILYILAFSTLLFVLALSGGRSNVVIALACAFVFIFFYSNNNKNHFIRNTLICLFVLIGVYLVIIKTPLLYNSIGERFESFFSEFLGFETSATIVSSDSIREKMAEIGLIGWLEAPIFGHGLDSYKYFCQEVLGIFAYSHNNYVELLYDLGLVGFVAYYWMYFYLFIKLIKMPKELLKYKILGIGLLVQFAISDFADISFYSTLSMMLLSVIYAIVKIANKNENHEVSYE